MKKQNKGFTLVELIVVIAILAILSVALIPIVNNLIEKSAISRVLADADAVKLGLSVLETDIGSLDSLNADNHQKNLHESLLVVNPGGFSGWSGPYVENISNSPFGQNYVFEPFNANFPAAITLGASTNNADTATKIVDDINLKVAGSTTPPLEAKKAVKYNGADTRVHVILLLTQ